MLAGDCKKRGNVSGAAGRDAAGLSGDGYWRGALRRLYPKRSKSQTGGAFLCQGAILSERSEFIAP